MACDLKRNLHQMSGAEACDCGEFSIAKGNAPRQSFDTVVEMFADVDVNTLTDEQVRSLSTRRAVLRRKGAR